MPDIDRYPHADYDARNMFGYLAYYYAHEAVKEKKLKVEQWRFESWSAQILDYKEGKPEAIAHFVPPFLELIECAVGPGRKRPVYLVPVPSSKAHGSPHYSRVPKDNEHARNRDDRNVVFCLRLIVAGGKHLSLRLCDVVRRTQDKPPKEKWSPLQHIETLAVDESKIPDDLPEAPIFVLVDDLHTDGGTMLACRMLLLRWFERCTVIRLALGKTCDPD
jgi:hypothetical protein